MSACDKGLALKVSPDLSSPKSKQNRCLLTTSQKILTKTSFIQFIIRKIRYSFDYFRHAHGTKTYIQARKMMPIKLCIAFLKRINQKTFAVFLKIYFIFLCVRPTCIYMGHRCAWCQRKTKVGTHPSALPEWSYRQLWVALWVLEATPRSSAQTASIPNCAILPAPFVVFINKYLLKWFDLTV